MKIAIYRFTGWQGLFKIPESWCRECDLLIRAVNRVHSSITPGIEITVKVRPWFLWFWKPLFQNGAIHAPILVIDGRLVSQGIVPSDEEIKYALVNNGSKT